MAGTAPLCLLEDAFSRVNLLRGLHVLAVRRLGEAEGKHFEGIQQAVKHRALRRRQLPTKLARSLREVELAVAYQRHADACMVENIVADLEAALRGEAVLICSGDAWRGLSAVWPGCCASGVSYSVWTSTIYCVFRVRRRGVLVCGLPI